MKKDIERITAFQMLTTVGITTIRQAVDLLAVNFQPGITSNDLAKILRINRTSTCVLCGQLEEKGLMTWETRENAPRRHARFYSLTEAGKEIIKLIRKA